MARRSTSPQKSTTFKVGRMEFSLECRDQSRGAWLYCVSPMESTEQGMTVMRQSICGFFHLTGGVVQTNAYSGEPVAMFPGKSLSSVIQSVASEFTKKHRHLLKL